MKKSEYLFIALGFIGILATSKSTASSFCGSIDFRKLTNQDLEQILYIESFSRGITPKQCGLPGEKLSICSACSNEVPEKAMQVLRPLLGSKAHSDWHAKWHKIRVNADQISDTLFEKIKAEGLVPPNATRGEFVSKYKQKGTLAGENFFYMHRMMIKMVQTELTMNGLPCIEPWRQLPETIDDAIWPVPRKHDSDASRGKDQFVLNQLKAKLKKYYDVEFLRKIPLNQLGSLLEFELHQDLHQFYRSNPVNSPEGLAQGFKDDLLPVETSPANKYFWKIHGLVDELIGAWLTANGFENISVDCSGKLNCYRWKATWIGKYPDKTSD